MNKFVRGQIVTKTYLYCMDYLTFSVVFCSFIVYMFYCRLSLLLFFF